ncbi:MAG: SRPBCC family protein [Balneolaceae bacterium]|nr:SRPBCC family protein [Balneolaceae bacterium]
MKNIRIALRINALFSFTCGALLLLLTGSMADLFGTEILWPFQGVGIGLVLFAFSVWYESTRAPLHLSKVLVITALDLLWVAGSAVIVTAGLLDLTSAGYNLIAATAVPVCAFALHQSYGLSHAEAEAGNPRQKALRFTIGVDADRAAVWSVISDIENYHEVASNIDDVRHLAGEGEGMKRTCYSGSDSWTETCTVWEPGRRYSFRVHTDAADYPYPFSALQGTWGIITDDTGNLQIEMIFELEYQTYGHVLLVHPFMADRFRPVCRDLMEAWKKRAEQDEVPVA